ncbi:MAG: hypothetical protein LBG84_09980 [Treponema sp.]|jgi:hypothetical protein|nr:hypothetical protein [Treponema sp.]
MKDITKKYKTRGRPGFFPLTAFLGAILALAGCDNPAGPGGPGTVELRSGVYINPGSVEVETGDTAVFQAAVSGIADKGVTWSVSGSLSPDTAIRATSAARAVLTVGADETAARLTVTAASTADSSKSASAAAYVVQGVGSRAYYVSAGGDDANAGTREAPYGTVAKALEAISGAYAGSWPGKGTDQVETAYIVISGELTGPTTGTGENSSSWVISSANAAANTYPPIELRGSKNNPAILLAGPARRVLYVKYNKVTLGPWLALTGGAPNNNGGGLYLDAGATVILNGADINNNKVASTTSYSGGGVYIRSAASSPTRLIIERGSIQNNEAPGAGGGVYATGVNGVNGVLEMRDGLIGGNRMVPVNTYTSNLGGGGVYLAAYGELVMTGGEITGNKVRGITSGTTRLPAAGGGVWAGAYASFSMTGGLISGNSVEWNPDYVTSEANAAVGGAGVYLNNVTTWRFLIGGSARIDQNNEVRIAAPATGATGLIAVREAFTGSEPAAKFDLAGQAANGSPQTRWMEQPLLTWDTGLSGPLPASRFTLGTFRRTEIRTAAGVLTQAAVNAPAAPSFRLDPDGILHRKPMSITRVTISAVTEGYAAGNGEMAIDPGYPGIQLKAVVESSGAPVSQTAAWSMSGNSSGSTTLSGPDAAGYVTLTVGAGETGVVVISAVSNEPLADAQKTGTLTIFIPTAANGGVADGRRTWYVNTASGNNAGHGRSEARALKSVRQAAALIKSYYGTTTALRGAWPRTGGVLDPARIIVNGTDIYTTASVNTNGAIAAAIDLSADSSWPPLYLAGKSAAQPGVLRVQRPQETKNLRVLYIGSGNTVTLGPNMTLTGGSLTRDGYSADGGAGVHTKGKLILEGGVIEGNRAEATVSDREAGGVYVYSAGALEIRSGAIRNNYSAQFAGGVFVDAAGVVTMTGGSIKGNTIGAGRYGKDLHIGGIASSLRASAGFKLSGDAEVGEIALRSGASTDDSLGGRIGITGDLGGSGATVYLYGNDNITLGTLGRILSRYHESAASKSPVFVNVDGYSGTLPPAGFNFAGIVVVTGYASSSVTDLTETLNPVPEGISIGSNGYLTGPLP